jgi:hypothetical protein
MKIRVQIDIEIVDADLFEHHARKVIEQWGTEPSYLVESTPGEFDPLMAAAEVFAAGNEMPSPDSIGIEIQSFSGREL